MNKETIDRVWLKILNNPEFNKLVLRMVQAGLPKGDAPLFSLKEINMTTLKKSRAAQEAEVKRATGGAAIASAKLKEEEMRNQAIHKIANQSGAVELLQRYRMLDKLTKQSGPDQVKILDLETHWIKLNNDVAEYLFNFAMAFPKQSYENGIVNAMTDRAETSRNLCNN